MTLAVKVALNPNTTNPQALGFINPMNNEVVWLLFMHKTDQWQKVSTEVSLRGLRRLTSVDTFCRCAKPTFSEHDSFICWSILHNITYTCSLQRTKSVVSDQPAREIRAC